jgi:hypothetical protein
MTNRARATITLATTLLLGAATYGHAFDFSPPGVLQDIWDSSEWMLYGLAVVGVFWVYRWWALLPAIAPVVVTIFLHSMTDYVSPWGEDEGVSLTPLFILLVITAIVIQAAILSVGLLLRAVWESVRSKRRKDTSSGSA